MSNKNHPKMGLNSNERKKGKSSGELPPSGRSWPFRRSKSKSKATETGDEATATDVVLEDRKCLMDSGEYPSSPSSPPNEKASTISSGSQDGRMENEGQAPCYQRSQSREDLTETFSPLTEREKVLFQDLQEV